MLQNWLEWFLDVDPVSWMMFVVGFTLVTASLFALWAFIMVSSVVSQVGVF